MYKQIIAVTLFALVAVVYANVDGWRDCGSTGIIRAVRAGPCTTAPCPFRRGEQYRVEMDATGTSIANSLPFNVTATILGLPWTIMTGNACDTVRCPTAVGDPIYFTYDYNVDPNFPPVPTTVTARVENHLGQVTICFELDVQIV